MENKGVLTKILAIAGTVLVWLPILAPILFSAIFLIAEQVFRFDYLMPAEQWLTRSGRILDDFAPVIRHDGRTG